MDRRSGPEHIVGQRLFRRAIAPAASETAVVALRAGGSEAGRRRGVVA